MRVTNVVSNGNYTIDWYGNNDYLLLHYYEDSYPNL